MTTKSMDAIMALCKRRGFIYQASEIYGGINGFWDYGPLGAQMKKNLREAWWQDMIMRPAWGRPGPGGKNVRCVPVETRIIQHPKVWEASGHVGGFNDPMVDCRETKARYRYDHLYGHLITTQEGVKFGLVVDGAAFGTEFDLSNVELRGKLRQALSKETWRRVDKLDPAGIGYEGKPYSQFTPEERAITFAPGASLPGTLTEPRQFNLMFHTYVGATASEDDKAYLRPETAQGIFVQFKNVVDTTRVKVPFGIGNTGTSFRNEVTPRNFTFRSREFDQAELEFFCHPDESVEWYKFWRDFRMEWWKTIGLAGENLILREHEKDELSHYSQGTSDVEYRFPFTAPGFGELEGIAHRGCYDLTQHQEHSKTKLEYFDQEMQLRLQAEGKSKEEIAQKSKYIPHCIEPAAGLDRGVLALLCEAYTVDPSRPSPELMKFHPRIAPIKAAVFPLVAKDGMPEIAEKLHAELSGMFWRVGGVEMDEKQSIGKRYARMDEAGCPFCFTIDGETAVSQTVTVRDRDSGQQERIALDKAGAFLKDKLGM
ncbi:MAG: glycine--tRNA ligase [Phycisphaerales bacterium]